MQLQPKFCMAFVNHHNTNGAVLPQVTLPRSMDSLDKHHGTCEDPNGIFQGFEKYLLKLLKLLGDQQRQDEDQLMV